MYEETLDGLSAERRGQVKIISFEGLATEPVEVLDDVARWLGTEQHPPMSVAIARERVPRVIDKKGLQKRLKTCAPRLTRFILKRWLSVVRNMSRNGDLKVPLAD